MREKLGKPVSMMDCKSRNQLIAGGRNASNGLRVRDRTRWNKRNFNDGTTTQTVAKCLNSWRGIEELFQHDLRGGSTGLDRKSAFVKC
jgi:hypothetical protein